MTMTPKRIKIIGIGIASTLVIVFIISRFSNVIVGPRILLDAVPDAALSEPAFTLSGKIKGGRLLWINQSQIPVDINGRFETQLVVPPGYTIMTLEAADELGARRTRQLPIYYLPQASPGNQGVLPDIVPPTDEELELPDTTSEPIM